MTALGRLYGLYAGAVDWVDEHPLLSVVLGFLVCCVMFLVLVFGAFFSHVSAAAARCGA